MNNPDWRELSNRAWWARRCAVITDGKTKVGAAAQAKQGGIWAGCNVQHKYRCHDIHAEVNALGSMAAHGAGPTIAILIAAERDRFTPCGGCLDWIFELGGPDCLVAFQNQPDGELDILTAAQLMPFYPH